MGTVSAKFIARAQMNTVDNAIFQVGVPADTPIEVIGGRITQGNIPGQDNFSIELATVATALSAGTPGTIRMGDGGPAQTGFTFVTGPTGTITAPAPVAMVGGSIVSGVPIEPAIPEGRIRIPGGAAYGLIGILRDLSGTPPNPFWLIELNILILGARATT